jgi:hypothetical protein
VAVVDPLEVVEVADAQRDDPGARRVELLLERAPVAEPGQRVGAGEARLAADALHQDGERADHERPHGQLGQHLGQPVRTRRVERGQQGEERHGHAERDEAPHRQPGGAEDERGQEQLVVRRGPAAAEPLHRREVERQQPGDDEQRPERDGLRPQPQCCPAGEAQRLDADAGGPAGRAELRRRRGEHHEATGDDDAGDPAVSARDRVVEREMPAYAAARRRLPGPEGIRPSSAGACTA